MSRSAINQTIRDLFGARFSEALAEWKANAPTGERRTNDTFAEDLGKMIGRKIDRGSVQKWCKGKNIPQPETRKAIAEVLGKSEDYFDTENATRDELYQHSSLYVSNIAKENINFANEIGLDVSLVRALSKVINFDECFPIYSPIEKRDGNFFQGYTYSRLPNENSCDTIDEALKFMQLHRSGETYTLHKADLGFLKEVQDQIIKYVKFLFYDRSKEMEEEVRSFNEDLTEQLENGGIAHKPITWNYIFKHDRLAKYVYIQSDDGKEGQNNG